MFKVEKCLFPKRFDQDGEGYLVIDKSEERYPFYVNLFLQSLSYNSPNTARQYAYRLCSFLNFLELQGVSYMDADDEMIRRFVKYLSIDTSGKVIDLAEGKLTRNSVKYYLTVIKQFYIALKSFGLRFEINLEQKTQSVNRNSLLYGSIWEETTYDFLITPAVDNSKKKTDYIKHYSKDEINAILDNLNTYRDQAIFALTLEGARIDEVLSLRFDDYDKESQTYQLYRSKGRKTGEVGRMLVLSKRTVELLDNYIFYERDVLENRLIDKDIFLGPEMFVNIKNNSSAGKPVQYKNYWRILKRAAARAGIPSEKIRTHSGRSTRAAQLYAFQAENPGLLTDQQITDYFGWRQSSSAFPYKNRQDKKTMIKAIKIVSEKINEK